MGNVLFLFGINGVGKSTMARRLASANHGTVVIGSSAVLRSAFGDVSREQLERTSSQEKHAALRSNLLRIFAMHEQAPLIVCDMHLLVAIRNTDECRYECMWDDAYRRFAKAYWYIRAEHLTVLHRRLNDIESGVRFRRAELSEIAADANANARAFVEIFGKSLLARIIHNDGATLGNTNSALTESLTA